MTYDLPINRPKASLKSAIPRSHSEFCYVNLTPKEKRRTTDFSHLLPQFHKDPPYVRLLDPNVPIIEQPKALPQTFSKICRSATGSCVSKSVTLDVIRSHSMRSLRKTLEMSPTRYKLETFSNYDRKNSVDNSSEVPNTSEEKDFTRLRNFSITSKGLVNWGDSFRSRSMPFVPRDNRPHSAEVDQSSSGSCSVPRATTSQEVCGATSCSRQPTKYKIAIMGSSNVGKTTMIKQFRTSEYICAFDSSSANDESNDHTLTVILNGEESELEFIDSCLMDDGTDEETSEESHSKLYIPSADAYVALYSVTSKRSFLYSIHLLSHIQNRYLNGSAILVGNKSDLVRIRAVTTDEGRQLAKDHNCQFMETSVAINHQVDELLVAILTEVRAKNVIASSASARYDYSQCSISKAKGLIKKFLKKACFQSKSCDNLQRL